MISSLTTSDNKENAEGTVGKISQEATDKPQIDLTTAELAMVAKLISGGKVNVKMVRTIHLKSQIFCMES